MIFLTIIFILSICFYVTRRLDRRIFNADLARQAEERRQLLDSYQPLSAGHQVATMVIDMQQAQVMNPPPPPLDRHGLVTK